MPYAQDLDTGEWVEVDAQGNPVASAPKAQGRVFTLPQSPKDAQAAQRQAAEDARKTVEFSERNAPSLPKGYQWKGGVVGGEAELIQGVPPPKAGGDATGVTAKIRADAIAAYQAGEAIKQRVAQMRELHAAGPGSTGKLTGITDLLPTEANKAFDQAGNAVRGHVGTALGFTGGQLNSVAEAQMAVGPYLPDSWDYDGNAVNKMDRLIEVANESQNRAIAVLGGVPDAAGNISPIAEQRDEVAVGGTPSGGAGPGLPGGNTPAGPAPLAIASGDSRFVDNPRANGIINGLMNAGASKGMIDAALAKQGLPSIRVQDYVAAKAWMQKNPGVRYNGATAKDIVPMSPLEKLSGAVGADSVGGSILTGGMKAADSASAGTLSAIGGERFRGNMDGLSSAYPNSAATGSIIGGVAGAAGAELMLAPKLGMTWGPRLADSLYGGVSGFNGAGDGEGLSGAALGATAGLAGGFAGEYGAKAAGAALRGVQDPMVRYLRDQGIPLTVGQTVGNTNAVGSGIKKMEDAATALPFVGDVVEERQKDGLRAINDAMFQRGAAPGATITARGAEGMQQVRDSVGTHYSTHLDPAQIDTLNDPQLVSDLAQLRLDAGAIPNTAPTFPSDYATTSLQNRFSGPIIDPNGMMSGRAFQESYRGLARDGRSRAAGDSGYEIGQVMRSGQDALGEALERQNPGAFDGFLEANAANRRANVLADALKNAANQGEELITPAQLNRADVTSTSRLEGKINSAAGNRPFYDLATAGQAVLPNKVPNSGTMTRLVTGGALTGALGGGGAMMGGQEGAATGGGAGLAATLALAFGGSKGVQRALTSALLDRPQVAIDIADHLKRYAPIGYGTAGGGLLASLVNGQ